jgi:hypothetical protein
MELGGLQVQSIQRNQGSLPSYVHGSQDGKFDGLLVELLPSSKDGRLLGPQFGSDDGRHKGHP